MANKKKVYFRADAGNLIGYGHFIRSLALADMLKGGFDCVFYTQTPTDYQKKEASLVCPLVALPSDDSKFDVFLNYLTGEEIVVLDNYFYTTNYQNKIKEKGCKLVCIDDMHDKHYVADIVVNHSNVKAEQFSIEPYTQLCLGRNWILLRHPFLAQYRPVKRNNSIIVCFGGADPYGLTEKIVNYLFELKVDYEIICIIGDTAKLSKDNRSRVKIMHNLSSQGMADLFSSSSIGIMPVSSVYMEAVSRGLKVIAGYFVDNQRIDFDKIKKYGDFIPVYNFNELTKEDLKTALDEVKSYNLNIPDYTNVVQNYNNLFSTL